MFTNIKHKQYEKTKIVAGDGSSFLFTCGQGCKDITFIPHKPVNNKDEIWLGREWGFGMRFGPGAIHKEGFDTAAYASN